MLSEHDYYVLLSKRGQELFNKISKNVNVDEVILALSPTPVYEITDEMRRYVEELIKLWKNGYAMPLEALKEIKYQFSGSRDLGSFKKEIEVSIHGSLLIAEPDANYEFALEFCKRIKDQAQRVLDVASGFGYIPAILSKKYKVYALDKNYDNRIVLKNGRAFVENTNIEIKKYSEDIKTYKDFCKAFWGFLGANLDNIKFIVADAEKIEGKYDIITCFFGLNHVENWIKVMESIRKSAMKRIYITIYREYLEKFPIKFTYNWLKELGVKMVSFKDFYSYCKKYFKVKVDKKAMFYLIELEKL